MILLRASARKLHDFRYLSHSPARDSAETLYSVVLRTNRFFGRNNCRQELENQEKTERRERTRVASKMQRAAHGAPIVHLALAVLLCLVNKISSAQPAKLAFTRQPPCPTFIVLKRRLQMWKVLRCDESIHACPNNAVIDFRFPIMTVTVDYRCVQCLDSSKVRRSRCASQQPAQPPAIARTEHATL